VANLSFFNLNGQTTAPFSASLFSMFNASTMTLTLTNPTTIVASSNGLSLELAGQYQFNNHGDLIGGTIGGFVLR
jgi:hypothetical protein